MKLHDKQIRDIKRQALLRVFKKLNNDNKKEVDLNELYPLLVKEITQIIDVKKLPVDENTIEFLANLCLLYARYKYFGGI